MLAGGEQAFGARIWISILIGRQFTEEIDHCREAYSVEHKATKPERHIHIPCFVVKQVIGVMEILLECLVIWLCTMDIHPLEEMSVHLWKEQRKSK